MLGRDFYAGSLILRTATSPGWLYILIHVEQIARIIPCFDLCQPGVVVAVCCLHRVCAPIHHHVDIPPHPPNRDAAPSNSPWPTGSSKATVVCCCSITPFSLSVLFHMKLRTSMPSLRDCCCSSRARNGLLDPTKFTTPDKTPINIWFRNHFLRANGSHFLRSSHSAVDLDES